MGKLILHIGTTKTGSTSLQRFLFDNREKLAHHGICYPDFWPQPGPTRLRNGAFIDQMCFALACGQDPKERVYDLEKNRATFAEALSSHSRTLLTDEDFSCSPGRLLDIGSSPEAYWPTLALILSEAGAQDVTLVVYLRRQDEWLASRWRQEIQSGRCEQPQDAFYGQCDVRCAMDYAGMLEIIEAAFGNTAQIVVRRFDRNSFEGGSIYLDFCAAANIPWDDGYRISEDKNPSISYDVAEALRLFKAAAPPNTFLRGKVLSPLALDLSRQNPDAPDTTPFDEGETRELMQPYLEGNRQIAEKYFGGKPLFSEEYGERPVWVPNEERIAEYRAAFENALRQHEPPSGTTGVSRALVRRLPKGAKLILKTARKKLLGR